MAPLAMIRILSAALVLAAATPAVAAAPAPPAPPASATTARSASATSAPASSASATAVSSTSARAPRPDTTHVGADVSDPQAGGPYAARRAFGVVGVNWPNAATANPWRTTEIDWAIGASGRTAQPKVQLYVLGAEPGRAKASAWPTADVAAHGTTVADPYGTCGGEDSPACAYVYGFVLGQRDAALVPHPRAFRWWLDIETAETWQPDTPAGHAQNTASIEGELAGLRAKGVRSIGVYSTGYQWGVVNGTVSATSPLQTLPNWLPVGVGTAEQAAAACSSRPLMRGEVVMTQYVVGSIASGTDHDVSCV